MLITQSAYASIAPAKMSRVITNIHRQFANEHCGSATQESDFVRVVRTSGFIRITHELNAFTCYSSARMSIIYIAR